MRVSDVLRHAHRKVVTIQPSAVLADAIKLLLQKKVRAIVVVQDERPLGIITVRDVMRHIDAEGAESIQHAVSTFMTKDLICAKSESMLNEVQQMFNENDIHHLIVVDDGKLTGLLTPADVLGRHLEHVLDLNEHLSDYILGGPLR